MTEISSYFWDGKYKLWWVSVIKVIRKNTRGVSPPLSTLLSPNQMNGLKIIADQRHILKLFLKSKTLQQDIETLDLFSCILTCHKDRPMRALPARLNLICEVKSMVALSLERYYGKSREPECLENCVQLSAPSDGSAGCDP